MNSTHRILITEEQTVFAMGLRALVDSQSGLELVGEAGAEPDMLGMVARFNPDLVLTDLNMAGPHHIDEIAAVRRSHPDTKVLILTQHKSEDAIRAALWAGASGYLLKDASNTELVRALRCVLDGNIYLSPSLSDNIINAFVVGGQTETVRPHLDALTERERQILTMVAEGLTNRRIAAGLELSVKTVEKHRSNLMKKLDLHNVSALTAFAIGQGLVSDAD